jgi:hypothetical protein
MEAQGTGLYDTLNNAEPMRASEIVQKFDSRFWLTGV